MKKMILITLGMIFLMAICVTLLTNSLKSEVGKIESKVGTKLILEKDTVMIIDYSLLKNSYTLSNGKEISFELVDKLPVVE